jgi:2-haloacid dehalogenase
LIKHVFLDLDDTLFDFHKSEGEALSNTLSTLGIEPTAENLALYSRINRSQWESLERGEVTRDIILVRRFEILFRELGIKDKEPKEAQRLYEGNLSKEYHYLPGAMELIQALLGKYKLYLASNGTAVVQDSRIALSGIGKYFDGIFISERIGHNKPSKEFFDGCFATIKDFSKDEAIIIGDSLTSDILGGINAGIKTCLYNPKGKPNSTCAVPDYEVKSLLEIPDLLLKI